MPQVRHQRLGIAVSGGPVHPPSTDDAKLAHDYLNTRASSLGKSTQPSHDPVERHVRHAGLS
jgi:hypothetical protein